MKVLTCMDYGFILKALLLRVAFLCEGIGGFMGRHGMVVSLMIIAAICLILHPFPLQAVAGEEEYDTAVRENLLPAQQGDPQAQIFLGYLYETGQGVPQNFSKAAQWYWKAAEQGNAVAQYQLGSMYHLGKGVSQNYVLAYMWLDLSAAGGNPNAKEIRRLVAGKMTVGEIADAKRKSEEWKLKNK